MSPDPSSPTELRTEIDELHAALSGLPEIAKPERDRARRVVARLLDALDRGEARAACPDPEGGGWSAVPWVKRGILLAFRVGETRNFTPWAPAGNPDFEGSTFHFSDRDTLPLRSMDGASEGVRIVPGGSSVRSGVHLAPGVVVMPPAYLNVGAYVDEGAMIDSHALVGSCAQVGKRVHLSAGAQLGGVLEPIGLRPVVIEDDAMIGANCGIFEGTLVGRGAVLAPGVQLTGSTRVIDLVRDTSLRATEGHPLSIPPRAVVVPGSRPAPGEVARRDRIHLYTPVIVKYRDEKTDAATALEGALR